MDVGEIDLREGGQVARILAARSRAEDARLAAAEASAILASIAAPQEGEGLVRLMEAETLHATGDLIAARAAITVARDHLLARAERIHRDDHRRSFLAIDEHARTLTLAAAWLAGGL